MKMVTVLALLAWLWWLKQVQALVSERVWLAGLAFLSGASVFFVGYPGNIRRTPSPISPRLFVALGYFWLMILAGYPYGIGFAFLTVGAFLDVWWLRRLGAVNVALAISTWVIPATTATIDSHWTVAPLTTLLARWAKLPVTFVEGQIVWLSAQPFASPFTLRMSFIPFWLMFFIAVAIWFWQGMRRWGDWFKFIGAIAGITLLMSLLWSVIVMTIEVSLNTGALLIAPSVWFLVALSYAFAIVPLEKGFSPSFPKQAPVEPLPSPFALRPLLFTFASALFLTFFFMPDLGRRKQGRIAFDEYHSAWEPIDVRYDTTDWREGTGYTFNRMAFFLGKIYRVSALRQPITPQALKDVDVLILKIPTLPYTKREVAAIKAWVRGGGGLWLIGDHTNVFGSATALNFVASAFGIVFRPDAIYPSFHSLTSSHWQECPRPPFLWHPIVAGSPHLTFYTSCSLHLPLFVQRLTVGAHMFSKLADYSRRNFFGEFDRTAMNRFGDYAYCVAKPFGKGRIVALGESTFLSNFGLPEPGTWELALHTVEWLNRQNAKGWNWLAIFVSGLLLLLSVFPVPRHSPPVPLPLYGLPIAFAIALTATDVLSAYASRPPKTIPLSEQVFFLFTEKERGLFIGKTIHDPSERMFHELFVSPQRIGLLPRLVRPNELPYGSARAKSTAVLVTPIVRLKERQVQNLANWVAKGGKLLWLIDPSGWERPHVQEETEVEFAIHPFFFRPSRPITPKTKAQKQEAAQRLLSHDPAYQHLSIHLGVAVKIDGLRESDWVRNDNGWSVQCFWISPLRLAKGGRVLGRLDNGQPAIAAVKLGKGEVVIAPFALTFAHDAFGASLQALNEQQKKRHFLFFRLLKGRSGW